MNDMMPAYMQLYKAVNILSILKATSTFRKPHNLLLAPSSLANPTCEQAAVKKLMLVMSSHSTVFTWLQLFMTQKKKACPLQSAAYTGTSRDCRHCGGPDESKQKLGRTRRGMNYAPTPRPCRTLLTADAYAGAPGACALPGVRSAKPARPQHPVRH